MKVWTVCEPCMRYTDCLIEFGCYVSRHGHPRRGAQFVRWETKATSFARRGEHILLFSSDFIEIRHARTSRLAQVIQGRDIRLLCTGPPETVPLLVARTGAKNDTYGQSDELIELLQTQALSTPAVELEEGEGAPPDPASQRMLWDEWDVMA